MKWRVKHACNASGLPLPLPKPDDNMDFDLVLYLPMLTTLNSTTK